MKARGAVIATLLGILLMSALYPLRQYASQDSHVNGLAKQEHALELKIAALRRQQDLLLSDAEIERVAREELGMVRPGEVAFAVVPDGAPASGSALSPRSPVVSGSRSGAAWSQRWWDALTSSLRGMR